MLFTRAASSANLRPNADYLLECIKSATSIISIFDLFCRSFGDGHCVLSVAYSVYMAVSILLLQVQGATSSDKQAIRRLEFCIRSLERVKSSNPGKLNNEFYGTFWIQIPNCCTYDGD